MSEDEKEYVTISKEEYERLKQKESLSKVQNICVGFGFAGAMFSILDVYIEDYNQTQQHIYGDRAHLLNRNDLKKSLIVYDIFPSTGLGESRWSKWLRKRDWKKILQVEKTQEFLDVVKRYSGSAVILPNSLHWKLSVEDYLEEIFGTKVNVEVLDDEEIPYSIAKLSQTRFNLFVDDDENFAIDLINEMSQKSWDELISADKRLLLVKWPYNEDLFIPNELQEAGVIQFVSDINEALETLKILHELIEKNKIEVERTKYYKEGMFPAGVTIGTLLAEAHNQAISNRKQTEDERKRRILKINQIHDKWSEEEKNTNMDFFDAVGDGNIDVVVNALKNGVDVNIQNPFGVTPLMLSIQNGHFKVAELLIEKGADVNMENVFGITALMHAADSNVEMVKLLIEKGADVNVQSNGGHAGWTLLIQASSYGNTELAKILIEKGADVNAKTTKYKSTALLQAAKHRHTETVKLLIESGVDVNAMDWDDCTALSEAAREGYMEIVKLLIKNGADVNAKTSRIPLNEAKRCGNTEIVQLLIENGAVVDAKDEA